ncbi:L-threonylcarbamoyladenylate synthase [Pseudoalteromonas byunsanensis]|uniref:Threonylcarbamoyl-AMP synthase n=1 Tax=Pseudoalteromonas byunsanensis TaxID=327939 RepID=A0A1S1N1Z1_9GAMM|nr:L-threonylcarbamoyladenylate synthase [Pseudoalteromonas byunsanensis]OHU93474.1 threonylcarbamoyl-AMP synthase [Pseudoalteromonas byunsanensis]
MITEVLAIDDEQSLDKALAVLRSGELVAIPTETVYGLAADANQPDAVRKIFAAKGRPADHPLIVHVDSVDKVERWVAQVPECVAKLADAFWPGPLTLILPKANHVSTVVTGGHSTVGIRVPNQSGVLKLLSMLDSGLAAPSANPYKRISPTNAEQVMYGMDGKIAAVLDGGPCEVGLESTILDVSTDVPRILRAGPITKSQIETVLGCEVHIPQSHNVAVPGNVKAHYQPSKPVQLLSSELLATTLTGLSRSAQNDIAVLYYSEPLQMALEGSAAVKMKLSSDKQLYGQNLYYALHQLDQADVSQIWVELPPTDELWLDVHDRLSRSSAK